jgi:hypothetical protein
LSERNTEPTAMVSLKIIIDTDPIVDEARGLLYA